jgi:hypothetical protein
MNSKSAKYEKEEERESGWGFGEMAGNVVV